MSSSEDHSSSRKRSFDRSRSRQRERREKKVRIKIPDLTEPLYSIRRFNFLQSDKLTPETLQKGYDKYKRDWEHHQNEEFATASRNEAWFNEKYNPELLDLIEKEKRQARLRNHTEFLLTLKEGGFEGLDLRVTDVVCRQEIQRQIGTVYEQEQDEESAQNFSNFVSNQTIDVVVDSNINISQAPFFGFDPDFATLFIKGLGKDISRFDIKAAIEKIEGVKNISMSDPIRKTNFTRNCWVEFVSEELCEKAKLQMSGLMIKQTSLNVSRGTNKYRKVKVLKNYPSSRLQCDIGIMKRLAIKLDKQVGIDNNFLLNKNYTSLQNNYDTLLLYLRKVHYFDFYTCTQHDTERMMTLKTGSAFLRIEADYQELPNTLTVFKKIQENAEKKIEEINEYTDYMGMLREEVENYIRESEKLEKDAVKDIWKCNFCDKKFKTCQFLAKHIIAKHEEVKLKKVQTIMEMLYQKDPHKITNYSYRDENRQRKNFSGGFKRDRRKEPYRDYDEPEGGSNAKVSGRPLVNFLDI